MEGTARATSHGPLLVMTKLVVPPSHHRLVARPRLLAQLDRKRAGPRLLIAAPPGFGTSTRLAQWVAESNMVVAWLALDAADNDPTRFLAHVIAALQTLDAQVGTTAMARLQTPQPPSPGSR